MRYISENPITDDQDKADLAAAFQYSVVQTLVDTMERQAQELNPQTLIVAGGVACNLALRESAEKAALRLGLPVYFPSKHLSTDNAAMIAAAGSYYLSKGEKSDLQMTADVTLRLQNIDTETNLTGKRKRYRT